MLLASAWIALGGIRSLYEGDEEGTGVDATSAEVSD